MEPGASAIVRTHVRHELNAELSMSSSGEAAMKGLVDGATYGRLQKDVKVR